MLPLAESVTSALLLAQDAPAGPFGGLGGLLPPMIMIGLLFYFLIARPERKRKAEMADMLGNLKKNDRVITIGGIFGVVVNASQESNEVTVRVDDGNNTRLRVLRSAISRVVTEGEGGEANDSL